ncbi:MAG: MBL fold metallo-hydrolase [Ruminococcaceae bacterium]|nr:MBL fold metallo-hydrolase [Oscillospiraceae bacterium]
MRFVTLVENTCVPGFGCAHGLSIYIETSKHKILFDAGPDGELLISNAEKMGIKLSEVDIAIISHGHYDHTGGLSGFLKLNSSAKIYMHTLAYNRRHFATENCGWRYIGPDMELLKNYSQRIILTEDFLSIDDELALFSRIPTTDLLPDGNSSLYEEVNGENVSDSFLHEQNLIICDGGKSALFAGCAHRGIINIIRGFNEIIGKHPDYVISGFHLTNPGLKIDAPDELVFAVANELIKYPCRYYTGHCTGERPFLLLKSMLGENLHALKGGLEETLL